MKHLSSSILLSGFIICSVYFITALTPEPVYAAGSEITVPSPGATCPSNMHFIWQIGSRPDVNWHKLKVWSSTKVECDSGTLSGTTGRHRCDDDADGNWENKSGTGVSVKLRYGQGDPETEYTDMTGCRIP